MVGKVSNIGLIMFRYKPDSKVEKVNLAQLTSMTRRQADLVPFAVVPFGCGTPFYQKCASQTCSNFLEQLFLHIASSLVYNGEKLNILRILSILLRDPWCSTTSTTPGVNTDLVISNFEHLETVLPLCEH